jgi:hypothetical protein
MSSRVAIAAASLQCQMFRRDPISHFRWLKAYLWSQACRLRIDCLCSRHGCLYSRTPRRSEAATSCVVVAEGADLGGIVISSDAAVNTRGYSCRAAERLDVAQHCLLARSSLRRACASQCIFLFVHEKRIAVTFPPFS